MTAGQNIAILGAGGFVGSHLVDTLIAQGRHEIVGLDLDNEKLKGIEGPNFRFVRADAADESDTLEQIIKDSDVVVDLIAHANPSIYVKAPLDVFELNFLANLRIVDLCVKHGKRLIQYSTSEVYGHPDGQPLYAEDESNLVMGPVSEQRWIYASSKQLLERVLHAHGLRGDLDYTIARPFNFIGPRLDYLVAPGSMGGPRVLAHFLSALLGGGPMYLVNGGHAHRSFTHILDANSAFVAMLENSGAHNEIFNIGNPAINISIRDFAVLLQDLYEELTGIRVDSELIEIGGEDFYGEGYADTDRVPPDVTKLRSLGWEPQRDLRTALVDTMEYYLDPANGAIPSSTVSV